MAKQADPKLVGYLNELVDGLREMLPAAASGENAKAVHHARVATRRLSAAMETLSPVLSSHDTRPFNKTLKHVRHALGELRDLDVMLSHLDGVAGHETAAAWMTDRLKAKRKKRAAAIADDLDVARESARLGSWWGVRPRLLEAAAAVDNLIGQSLHLQLDAFATAADGLAGAEKPSDPHAVRIAGKSLRYTVEMAVSAGHKLPGAVVGSFKRMQDALGAWHDMAVVAEEILAQSLKQQLPLHDLPLQADLLSLAGLFLRQGGRQLAKFESVWRQQRGTLPDTIRGAFPLTTELKTGLGPTDSEGPRLAGAVAPESAPGTG